VSELFDSKADVAVPRVLFKKLCCSRENVGIRLAVEWLARNPLHKKEFVATFSKLDEGGFKSFCLSANHYVRLKERNVNVLLLARRAVQHQAESIDRAKFKDQLVTFGHSKIRLSNGVECTFEAEPYYHSPEYWATFKEKNVKVRFKLSLHQIMRLRKTVNNVRTLEKIRPNYAEYETQGEWCMLDPKLTAAILNAIIAGYPITIAPLLA
jgi:hypothetical protein